MRWVAIVWPVIATAILVVWLLYRDVFSVQLPDHGAWIAFLVICGLPALVYGAIEYRRLSKRVAKPKHLRWSPLRLALVSIPCWVILSIVMLFVKGSVESVFALFNVGLPLLIFEIGLGYSILFLATGYLLGLSRAPRRMALLGLFVLILTGYFTVVSAIDYGRNLKLQEADVAEILKAPIAQRRLVRLTGGTRSATSRPGPAYFEHGTIKAFFFSIFNINRAKFNVGVSNSIDLALLDNKSGSWIVVRFEGIHQAQYWQPANSIEGLLLPADDKIFGFTPNRDFVNEYGRQPSGLLLVGQKPSVMLNRVLRWFGASILTLIHLLLCWFQSHPDQSHRIDRLVFTHSSCRFQSSA
ncbi:MAG: hypothetical protein U0930_08715 [Pirellulales bacterium]